jgi:hypothetical protein
MKNNLQTKSSNPDTDTGIEDKILAIPVKVEHGRMSGIEKALAMATWGWLVERYIDEKITERGVVA